MKCRHCGKPLEHVFLDLGFAPPSNAYLQSADLHRPERYLPLKLFVCDACWLVQTEDYALESDLFTPDYAYFSSISRSWMDHARRYVVGITEKLRLNSDSFVVEIASNDGYLLRNFVDAGIPCLGIEPTAATASASEVLGVPVLQRFFGTPLAHELVDSGRKADLVIGNNVFAHVPDVNDFTEGMRTILKPEGVITLEFPHLARLIDGLQFDTVYHEHFSYLSLGTVSSIFEASGLRVFDVEQLPTHGGSLRVYGCLASATYSASTSIATILADEERQGLRRLDAYMDLQASTYRIRDELLTFLIAERRAGRTVAAYGAAAKGNTLLNFAGVKPDLLSFVCDAAPSKQGRFLPGSHIPILHPDALNEFKPDTVLLLPWNLQSELVPQLSYISTWGARIALAVPSLQFVT